MYFFLICVQDPAEVEPGNFVPDGHLPASCELVESSEVETASNDDLWRRLQSIDSDSAARIHPNDRRKVKRYMCVFIYGCQFRCHQLC